MAAAVAFPPGVGVPLPTECCQRLVLAVRRGLRWASHCLKTHFQDNVRRGSTCHVLMCHSYAFCGEVCVQVFGPFCNQVVFLLLSFKSLLYVLGSSLLSYVPFANNFSQSVACFLMTLTLSFAESKFLILILPYQLFILVPLALYLKSLSH